MQPSDDMTIKAMAIGVFVLLLVGGAFIASKAEAKKVGDTCETYQSSACSGPGGACLASRGSAGNYCSIECKAESECPSSWRCASISSETYSSKTGKKVAEEAVRMCVRP